MEFFAKGFCELTTTELYEILKSRSEVFLLKQNIICQDLDGIDYNAMHFFIWDNDRVIGYARAFYTESNSYTVKIGRVLSLQHGKGIGTKVMQGAISYIADNMKCKRIILNSQKHAKGFYEKLGFRAVTSEFLEERVIHITMELRI